MNQPNQTTIIFSGGGTGGSVTPLLAVAEEFWSAHPECRLVFVGTQHGPERKLIADFESGGQRFIFQPLISGKLRRYFSLANFLDIFKIIVAFFASFSILSRYQPQLVVSAGSFVSVPLIWAAALRRIPVLIHQQDVRPGLANKLMAPFARVVTVTFEKSILDYGPRAVWTGNPVSHRVFQFTAATEKIREQYGLEQHRPFVLVTGGSSGSRAINELVFQSAENLSSFCQVLHLTGRGKGLGKMAAISGYQQHEFLSQEQVALLTAVADLVVSRAGLGALSLLSALAKPSLIIPLPNSHQEDNAALLAKAQAAIVARQADLNSEKFVSLIKQVLSQAGEREKLGLNLNRLMKAQAAENIAGLMEEIISGLKYQQNV